VKPLMLHVRCSPLRWLPVPLTILAAALLIIRSHYWIGIWPETGAAGQVTAYFISIVGAGASAWASGSIARNRMSDQLSAAPISTYKINLLQMITVLILILPTYFLAHLGAALVTLSSATAAGLGVWAGYFLMGLLNIFLAIAWGWLFGKFLSSLFAALSAVLSWVIFQTLLLGRLDLGVASGSPEISVNIGVVTLRMLAALFLIASIIGLPYVQGVSRKGWRSLALSTSAIVLVGASLAATSVLGFRKPPSGPPCVKGVMQLCFWPEHTKYRSMISSFDSRAAELPQIFKFPARVNEYGLDPIRTTGDVVYVDSRPSFVIQDGNRWSLALSLSNDVVSETFKGCDFGAVERANDNGIEQVGRWLEGYLAGGGVRDYRTSGVSTSTFDAWRTADGISSLPLSQQLAWSEREVTRLRAAFCA